MYFRSECNCQLLTPPQSVRNLNKFQVSDVADPGCLPQIHAPLLPLTGPDLAQVNSASPP